MSNLGTSENQCTEYNYIVYRIEPVHRIELHSVQNRTSAQNKTSVQNRTT